MKSLVATLHLKANERGEGGIAHLATFKGLTCIF